MSPTVKAERVRVETQSRRGRVRIRVHGRLEGEGTSRVRAAIDGALKSKPDSIHLDLSDLEFFGSAGIQIICELVAHCLDRGVTVTLSMKPEATRILELVGLGWVANITVPASA